MTGVWSGEADEDGITMCDLKDRYNGWTEITPSGQSKARAYELAAKVWPHVQAAGTLADARDILRNAGCSLHGYCSMD